MARKYQVITELYHDTIRNMTSPQVWQQFLSTACRNYRLSFDEQVLLFAQRPDATAVLPIDGRNGWNRRFGRWVNRGATGIAVFDGESVGRSRLKYYFDISDTHRSRFSRPVPLWRMRPDYEEAVIEALENSFGDLGHRDDLAEALISAVSNAVEDNMQDYLTELKYYKEDSFLEGLDDLNLEVIYRTLLKNSIAYMLLSRCGIDPEQYFTNDDFRSIAEFSTQQTLNALGTATGDIGQMCLSTISRSVNAQQRRAVFLNRTFADGDDNRYAISEKQNTTSERGEYDEQSTVHAAGRLQTAEPSSSSGAGGSPWEIRYTPPELSEKNKESDLYQPADIGQTEHTPDGDRADSAKADEANGIGDGHSGRRDGAAESGEPHEMGRTNEQHPSVGGGSDPERADLPVNTENSNEILEEADSAELPAFLDESLITAIISNKDDDLKFKKQQIVLYFSVHPGLEERAAYLKSAYPDRYTEILVEDVRAGYKPMEDGLLMWEGSYLSRTSESVFSWGFVAEMTAQMIEKREYFINTSITPPKNVESQQLSLFDFTDFNQQAEPNEQVSAFPRLHIPQQIVDEAICIGANDEHSRLIIAAYFKKDYPMDQNAAFLQNHYRENGAGFYVDGRQYALWYDAEGIRVSGGESARGRNVTRLNWEQVAKRIRELLDLGRYMQQTELDRVDDYERQQLASQLVLTARDLTEEAKNAEFLPLTRLAMTEEGGYSEIQKLVEELLADPEMVQRFTDEWTAFAVAHEQNPDLLRFRFYRTQEICEKLQGLQREPVIFRVAEGYEPNRRFYISSDEIDKLLRGTQEYRLSVYSFFVTHTDNKEREKYLKAYHGEYSGSHGGNDDVTYTAGKGISFSHGSLSEPYAQVHLNWNQVTKRVADMIRENRFLSDADVVAMPKYEMQRLSQEIVSFFYNAPNDMPRPYEGNSIGDYWKCVQAIQAQLSDPVRVHEIYETMMLPLWEDTAQDDQNYLSRKDGLEAMQAYIAGTYSVFGMPETLRPLHPLESSAETEPEVIESDQADEYRLLDRLRSDCDYFLGAGERAEKHLWAGSIDGQIAKMRELYDELREKPEWLSAEEIDRYEREMKADRIPAEKETSIVGSPHRRNRITFEMLNPEIPSDQRSNFHISDDALGNGTRSEKYATNVAAIRTLKQIESEDRLATPEEQEILSHYVGWGGLADCFDEHHGKYLELKSLLDEEEYAAARASTLTAFYTSPVIIKSMYQALVGMGLREGNLLEPACGVGNFIGMQPVELADCRTYGVELDSISGRIARQLYQNSSIAVSGFERAEMPDSFFDAAIGNVPFGDFKVSDRKYDKYHWLIHDYFFGKTLDKVRPGGVIAFITSKGTMDKENSAVRKYLAQRADLIGAIRLPNDAFKANAGTEVTSDILFLQKRDRIVDLEPDWIHLDTDENGIRMNSYFVQHPEMVLGEMIMESTRFGMDSTCKPYADSDLSELLSEAIQNLHAVIADYDREELDEEDLSIPADPSVRNFSYTLYDGKIYFRENSVMYPIEVSVTAENRIRGMIALRDCVRTLIEYQTENYPDEEIQEEQERLNTLYDQFEVKYGRINSRGNSLAFSEDSAYYLLCSLEVLDNEGNFLRKADMFTKRTIRSHEPVTSVDTASEALAVSISEKAGVDMGYMTELAGKTAEELETELSGVIFRDIRCAENIEELSPAHTELERYAFVTADAYLSGNVRRKLRMVQALYEVLPAEKKTAVVPNIRALEAVQPVDLTAAEIGVRIGANWVPMEIYQQFMYELFGTSYYARSRIHILRSSATGQWSISEKGADRGNVKSFSTYGTSRMSAYHILEQTLNQKDVRVFDYVEDADGKKKPVLNKKETAIAQDRQELIKQKFSEWIWKDIDRREKLCRIYNETFNCIRPREYDGSHIRFSGMNPEITLRPHQINAIAHIMYGGNTLLAHEVGAGKTFEIVAAAMEMKRLGLCTKSLIVVPNHIVGQWASEWLQLYPSANLLVATKKDFETQNRKKLCARISTGDYDAIIIGHSQFEKIPISYERQVAIIEQQIEEIMFSIEEAKSAKAEKYTVKQLERTRKSLETKLEKLTDRSRKDDIVTFEELGVDRIFIDESHYFKNLFLATKMRNVGGIAQTEAQKSSDLFMKCRYLDELTGGRGCIFATGTPISNSMVELYTIQRYLQYDLLQEMGLIHFDDWASDFGETLTAIELSPEGYTLIGR